jgi:hypothetical protein
MTHRRFIPIAIALALCAIHAAAGRAYPQQVRSAITPDTILVGDIFYAALRVELPPGVTLSVPDTLPLSGAVENAGRVRRNNRELPGGSTEVTLGYPLTAWRPGEHTIPDVTVVLSGPDGRREQPGAFPTALVLSVLPADTAGVEPRPPKDVLGPSRLLWPWVLGAVTLVGALAALVYYRRRRGERAPRLEFDVAHAGSPRERALAALDLIRRQGLLEDGRLKEFYSGTIAALRAFLEEFDTAWGAELTSTELVRASRGSLDDEDAAGLAAILDAADQVKFNRRQPAHTDAVSEWEAVRSWISGFHLRAPSPSRDDTSGQGASPAPDRTPEERQ